MKTLFYRIVLLALIASSSAEAEKFMNDASKYCLDTDGRKVNSGEVRIWQCADHSNQTWDVLEISDKSYRVKNKASGYCLDTDGRKVNGGAVRMWECADHPNQTWEIIDLTGGLYRLKNKASGYCLDTDGGRVNGGGVRIWECADHQNQRWLMYSDFAMMLRGGDINGVNWCGQWETNWGSPTGGYRSRINIQCSGQVGAASGTYNNGTLKGLTYFTFDQLGQASAVRFEGEWRRTQGDSGGACQYGRFYLDLTARWGTGTPPLSKFFGYWTYCNDDPLGLSKKWAWYGNEIR
jgi:hypothetical protein